jgi:hypothetical protein
VFFLLNLDSGKSANDKSSELGLVTKKDLVMGFKVDNDAVWQQCKEVI